MKNNLIVACLQLTSSSDIYKNLKETIDLSNKAIDKGASFVSTPEVTNIETITIKFEQKELKTDIKVNTNEYKCMSKEDIIFRAITYHKQGKIIEAEKSYRNFP